MKEFQYILVIHYGTHFYQIIFLTSMKLSATLVPQQI